MPHILIVEDEAAIADTLLYALQAEGFATTWVTLAGEALALQERQPADLLILDVGLPDISGFEACKRLRRFSEVPVIFLTARDAEIDRVVGLEIGADDYVSKPCEPRVLLARIRTLLRRCQLGEAPADDRLTIGQLRLLPGERQVWWRDQLVELSSTEFNLLAILMRHAGEVLSRDQLIQQLRGIEFNGVDRSVDVAISKLRRRFEEHPGDARRIKTVWGKGYLLSRAEWE